MAIQRHRMHGVEGLEDRRLMAGDVTASLSAGDLRVLGDGQSNEFAIRATSNASTFYVEGLNGTTVNGQSGVMIQNVSDDIRVYPGQGDNRVLLTGADPNGTMRPFSVPDDLTIATRNGNDVIVLDHVRVGDTSRIYTYDGDDTLAIYQTDLGGALYANMGDDNDLFAMDQSSVGGLTSIRMGDGKDMVGLDESTFYQNVDVELGNHNDVIGAYDSVFAQTAEFDGGSGFDRFLQDKSSKFANLQLNSIESTEHVSEDDFYDEMEQREGIWDALELIFGEGSGW